MQAVSARSAFLDYRDALRRRREHGGPPITDQERRRLLAHRDAWEEQYQRFPAGSVPGVPGGMSYIAQRPPSRESVEAEFGSVGVASHQPPVELPRRERRQRPSHQLPTEKGERLADEIAKRRAAGNPHRGPLTLEQIATRVGLDVHRVAQGRDLTELGWDLLRSDPEFPPDRGYVRWPTVAKAKRLLGL